ncbi:MAG: phosphate/phosphite/phosphonate ABC transporter substrate-binding protein [Deltaproteobacteria bacterium]|nr:phosphate/phosphite/phosphonate ABC transporter substrate-binding protein [Deltaproteobacteria bacterium]
MLAGHATLWLGAVAAMGCAVADQPPRLPPTSGEPLQFGLIPEQNIFNQLERYEPLALYLGQQVGRKITLMILPRYGNIIDNFKSEGLHGAFFGSFTYVLAHAKLGVEVVARPLSLDNSSMYRGLMFTRRASGIRSCADMRGKRFAFVDRATTAGYLLPLRYFQAHQVEWTTYLKEGYFAGTHEGAISDVLNGMADVGAAKNTVFNRMAAADPRIEKELVVLEQSPEVPENALALRKDLDPSLSSRVKEALLRMHLDANGKKVLERFGAQRFIETTNADYAAVLKYAAEAQLDMATYDYLND